LEANRIYREFCAYNPAFQTGGRVHIIGHSLGSALTLDILSNQPSKTVTPELGLDIPDSSLIFDTKNLFWCGSPTSIFMLQVF
jgi:hypothetical protein